MKLPKKHMAKKTEASSSIMFCCFSRHRKKVQLFLDSVTQVIGACGRSQEWQSALHLFTEHLGGMPKSGDHAFAEVEESGFNGSQYIHITYYIYTYIYICMYIHTDIISPKLLWAADC